MIKYSRHPLRCIICALLILTVGGNWAILQCTAWTTMVLRFALVMPLEKAIEQTFDGEHPCELCLLARQAKETEQKNDVKLLKTEFLLFVDLQTLQLCPPVLVPLEFSDPCSCPERLEAPPSPPPRAV